MRDDTSPGAFSDTPSKKSTFRTAFKVLRSRRSATTATSRSYGRSAPV